MKWKGLTVVEVLIVLAILGVLAAIVVPAYRQKSRPAGPYVSADAVVEVTLPQGWTEAPSANPHANVKIGDPRADIYLIVVSEKKSEVQGDNNTLQKYSQNTRARMTQSMSGVRQEGPWWVTIGGFRAVRYEVFGTSSDGMRVSYLHTVVETPTYFHQVVGWGESSNYPEHRKTLIEVSDSLREAAR